MLIDTHAHIDGEEFKDDLPEVIERAKAAGIGKIFVPAINLQGMDNLMAVCHKYPGYAYPMIGLHPEDVKDDYLEVIDKLSVRWELEFNGFTSLDLARDFGYDEIENASPG